MAIENTQVVALYLKGAYSSGKHKFIHGIIKYRMLSTSMKIDNPYVFPQPPNQGKKNPFEMNVAR